MTVVSLKELAKGAIQRVVFSGPVYARLRAVALRRPAAMVPDARDQISRVAPRPEHMRVEPAPRLKPTIDLTVVVPARNVDRFVGACLDSVMSQDVGGRTFEVIVVDDGSTDDTVAAVSVRAERDKRVRLVRCSGLGPAARNVGIDLARGRYLAFVDADDLLAPGHFAALFARMDCGDVDMVSSLWRRIAEDGTPLGLGERTRTHATVWGRLYRREVWERLRIPQGCWYEDLIIPICVQPLAREAFVDDAGYLYRVRRGSIVEESVRSARALDAYWVLDELLGWRRELGITYGQGDLDRLVEIMGPTLMGRAGCLDVSGLRALFSLHCDLLASLTELSEIRTSRGGAWRDVELALRERRFELWCLACAATATDSGDVKMLVAWSRYRQAMGQR